MFFPTPINARAERAVNYGFTGETALDAARKLAYAGVGVIVLCACVGRSRTFLNLTSNLPLYTARLTRAYLGASNHLRRNPDHGGVTKPEIA